jgi:putative transposase
LVDVELCIVHQIRNSTKFIGYKDRKAFCIDLKKIHGATTLDAAQFALDELDEKWGSKYPGSIKSWRTNWVRLTAFFKYPPDLRLIIYTTNSIESFNSVLRKNTSSRKVFPNDDAVMKILFLNMRNFTKNGGTDKIGISS